MQVWGGRRLLTAVAVALAVLLVAEVSVRALAGPLREPVAWRDAETAAKAAQTDQLAASGGAGIVAIGSSMTNAAIDPTLLSDRLTPPRGVYNGALNGASIETMETWLDEVLRPRLRPDLVLIGLSSRELNANGRNQVEERTLFETSPGVERLTDGGGTLARIERSLEDASALVRYRSVLRRPLEAFDDEPGPDAMVGPGGVLHALRIFEGADYNVTPDFRARTEERVLNDFEVGDEQVAALTRIVRSLQAAGIRVAIVVMPITDDAIAMHPRGAQDYARFQQLLDGLADDVPVIDLTPAVHDLTYFADPFHLDDRGRATFTEALAAALGGQP